jgi:hypothetical protein
VARVSFAHIPRPQPLLQLACCWQGGEGKQGPGSPCGPARLWLCYPDTSNQGAHAAKNIIRTGREHVPPAYRFATAKNAMQLVHPPSIRPFKAHAHRHTHTCLSIAPCFGPLQQHAPSGDERGRTTGPSKACRHKHPGGCPAPRRLGTAAAARRWPQCAHWSKATKSYSCANKSPSKPTCCAASYHLDWQARRRPINLMGAAG